MPVLKVSWKFKDKVITRAMHNLARAGGDSETMLSDIGEYMLIATEERFDNEVAPSGFAWPEILDSTRAKKRNRKILTESNRLRGSIIYRASSRKLEVGTNVKYAAIHQFGGKTRAHEIRAKNKKALFWAGSSNPIKVVQHPGSQIPARPYLGVSSRDRTEILAIVHKHYRRALAA